MKTCFVIAALGVGLALPCPARAQAPQPTATQKAAAIQRYEAGVKLFDQAEWKNDAALYEAAYTEFAQAWAVYPDTRVLWNLAVSEYRTKRTVAALHHFHEFDAKEHVSANPSHRRYADLRSYVDAANKVTAHLAVEAPAGARISLDGVDVGAAPFDAPIDTTPGDHELRSRINGKGADVTACTAPAGVITRVVVGDVPPPAPVGAPLPEPAVAPVPSSAAPVGGQRYLTERRTIGLIVAGVGLGSVVASVVFASSSTSAASNAAGARAQLDAWSCPAAAACAPLESARNDEDRDRSLSIGLGAVGAAAITAGAVLFFWPRATEKGTRAAVVPFVTSGSAGLTIRGEL